ncbi:MAG: hypothetical protein KJ709_03685 [Nanoarchaeota archaeon]|nr:hypothetical protein [Nanoarchaeota archaeon]
MSHKINILDPNQELVIKWSGLIDMDGLYKKIWEWYKNRKFEVHEKTLKDKGRAEGREEEIKIDAFRNDTDFFRVWINLYIHTWELNRVDVVVDGKKKKMEKGRFKVTMRLVFEADYENRWEKSKFFIGLRTFYLKYFMNRKIQTYGDKLEYELHNLHEVIKQHLGMEAAGNQYSDMW